MHRCFFFFHHIGLPLSFKDWAAPSSYISTPLAGAFGLQSSIFVLTNCQNKINLKVLAQDNLCCCPEQQQLMILSITIHHTSALTSYVDMASTSQFYCTDHTYIYILIYICWDIYIYSDTDWCKPNFSSHLKYHPERKCEEYKANLL